MQPQIIALLILIIAITGCVEQEKSFPSESAPVLPEPNTEITETVVASDEPPLKLKNIGFNLDYYNSNTGFAGDMKFTKEQLFDDRVWADFGTQDPRSPDDPTKRNVQPVFLLPLGTKVYSLVDGTVVGVSQLYSGDYSIHVTTDEKNPWRYETEHVINPLVKIGDKVVGGQTIAEVSTWGSQNAHGLGVLDIGILKGGNPPIHVCPFKYLDPSIKEETYKKIMALYKSWEDYKSNYSIYDEENYASPGCASEDPAQG